MRSILDEAMENQLFVAEDTCMTIDYQLDLSYTSHECMFPLAILDEAYPPL